MHKSPIAVALLLLGSALPALAQSSPTGFEIVKDRYARVERASYTLTVDDEERRRVEFERGKGFRVEQTKPSPLLAISDGKTLYVSKSPAGAPQIFDEVESTDFKRYEVFADDLLLELLTASPSEEPRWSALDGYAKMKWTDGGDDVHRGKGQGDEALELRLGDDDLLAAYRSKNGTTWTRCRVDGWTEPKSFAKDRFAPPPAQEKHAWAEVVKRYESETRLRYVLEESWQEAVFDLSGGDKKKTVKRTHTVSFERGRGFRIERKDDDGGKTLIVSDGKRLYTEKDKDDIFETRDEPAKGFAMSNAVGDDVVLAALLGRVGSGIIPIDPWWHDRSFVATADGWELHEDNRRLLLRFWKTGKIQGFRSVGYSADAHEFTVKDVTTPESFPADHFKTS